MFRSGNPALKAETFDGFTRVRGQRMMTVHGTVNKTGISLLILIAAGALTWNIGVPISLLLPVLYGSLGCGFVVALVTVFKQEWAPATTPVYAALEGVVLGIVSMIFDRRYPGIALNAAALTIGTLAVMLVAYRSGAIRASENFTRGIVAATGAIALVYLVSIGVGFFGGRMPLIHDSGPIGILFSLVVV